MIAEKFDSDLIDRELFHQRQYRHDPIERPEESSQRHYSTMTAPYMLNHPFGSAEGYSA